MMVVTVLFVSVAHITFNTVFNMVLDAAHKHFTTNDGRCSTEGSHGIFARISLHHTA